MLPLILVMLLRDECKVLRYQKYCEAAWAELLPLGSFLGYLCIVVPTGGNLELFWFYWFS